MAYAVVRLRRKWCFKLYLKKEIRTRKFRV